MSEKYKIRDNERAYFITMTVVGWIAACRQAGIYSTQPEDSNCKFAEILF